MIATFFVVGWSGNIGVGLMRGVDGDLFGVGCVAFFGVVGFL